MDKREDEGYRFGVNECKDGGITESTPDSQVRLEYPRQTNAVTSYTDINNFGTMNIVLVNDIALHDIVDTITNTMQRVQ